MIERKFISDLHLKFEEEDAGTFTGIAAGIGNVDKGSDVILEGAFTKSLDEHKSRGTKPVLLWQHKHDEPIGVIDYLNETGHGLLIRGRLAINTSKGREAYEHAKLGSVTGLSIGYRVPPGGSEFGDVKGRRCRKLKRVELSEVSFVSIPMNDEARITSIKSADGGKEKTMTDYREDTDFDDLHEKMISTMETTGNYMQSVQEELKSVNSRLDNLELKTSRPGVSSRKSDETLETKAFSRFLRSGREALDANEVKSLRVADDAAGGYLAIPDFVAQVEKNLVQFSPIRQIARVGTTGHGSVVIPKLVTGPTAAWVGEIDERAETGETFGQIEIAVHEMGTWIDISQRLLEDAMVNVESDVAYDLSQSFAKLEGASFVNGDGVAKPEGLLANADIPFVKSGDATHITADALISMIYSLKAPYRANGTFVMNAATLAAVRLLKDQQDRYLWQPSLAAGQPETLLGRPVVEAPDMPDVGAGAFPILFGDFNAGYRIYDRVNLTLMRDPYTQAKNGLVRFHSRRRVGGAVVRSEALTKLKIAA